MLWKIKKYKNVFYGIYSKTFNFLIRNFKKWQKLANNCPDFFQKRNWKKIQPNYYFIFIDKCQWASRLDSFENNQPIANIETDIRKNKNINKPGDHDQVSKFVVSIKHFFRKTEWVNELIKKIYVKNLLCRRFSPTSSTSSLFEMLWGVFLIWFREKKKI